VFYNNLDGQKTAADFSLLLIDQILYITVSDIPPQAIQLEVLINNSALYPLLDQEQRGFDGDGDENQGGGYSYVYSL
jgi:hypothetical protein